MGKSPPDPVGGDHSAGPWQRRGTVGEGGPAHPDIIATFVHTSSLSP